MNKLKVLITITILVTSSSGTLLNKSNRNNYNEIQPNLNLQSEEGQYLDGNLLNQVRDILLRHEQLESRIFQSVSSPNGVPENGYGAPNQHIVGIQFADVKPSLQLLQFRHQNAQSSLSPNSYGQPAQVQTISPSIQIPTLVLPLESNITPLRPVNSYGAPLEFGNSQESSNSHFINSELSQQNVKELRESHSSAIKGPIVVDDAYSGIINPSINYNPVGSGAEPRQNIQILESQSYQMPTNSYQIKEFYNYIQSPSIDIQTKAVDDNEELLTGESAKTSNYNIPSASDIHYIITPLSGKTKDDFKITLTDNDENSVASSPKKK